MTQSHGGIRYSEQTLTDRVVFTPEDGGRKYESLDYHRKHITGKKNKTLWRDEISRVEEFLLFRKSEARNWLCTNGNFWVVGEDADGKHLLGQGRERIACFPKRSNANEPWHGYPCRADAAVPPAQILSVWVNSGVITRSFKRRLQRELV